MCYKCRKRAAGIGVLFFALSMMISLVGCSNTADDDELVILYGEEETEDQDHLDQEIGPLFSLKLIRFHHFSDPFSAGFIPVRHRSVHFRSDSVSAEVHY